MPLDTSTIPSTNGEAKKRPSLRFTIGEPDKREQRLVVAYWKDVELHRSKLDPEADWQRAKFIANAIAKMPTGEIPYHPGGDSAQIFRSRFEGKFVDALKELDALDIPPVSPVVVNMADVIPQKIDWLWPDRIALGKLNNVAGEPGLGKSFVMLAIAAAVSKGSPWPDKSGCAPLGGVVWLGAEDDVHDTVRPRLDSAGADCSKIVALQAVKMLDGKERLFDLSRDITALEAAAVAQGDTKLVIIDPISAFGGKSDANSNAEVRGMLAPLAEMAARLKFAVLMVTHMRKSEGAALHRSIGSIAFMAAARSGFIVAPDRSKPGRRYFLPVKNNVGNDRTGMAFYLSARHTTNGIPCIEWDGEVDLSADEALAPPPRKKGPKSIEQEKAEKFLREVLRTTPRPTKDVEEEAREVHGITPRTLKRARIAIGVDSYRPVVPGAWWLRLPDSNKTKQEDQHAAHELLGTLGSLPQQDQEDLADREAQEDIENTEDQEEFVSNWDVEGAQ